KHAVSSTSISSINTQSLDNTRIGIDAERRVPHAERPILQCEFPEPRRHIDVASLRAITSLQNLILAFVPTATDIPIATAPAAVPSTLPPIATAPAGKHGAIDGAAFGELKHAVSSASVSRVNAQNLKNTRIRINPERRVAHTECSVLACEFLQS